MNYTIIYILLVLLLALNHGTPIRAIEGKASLGPGEIVQEEPATGEVPEPLAQPSPEEARARAILERKAAQTLAVYRRETRQAINEWLERGSGKATLKAYCQAPSTQPGRLQAGAWTPGAVLVALLKMGHKGMPFLASGCLIGYACLGSFMDGLVGLEKASLENDEKLKRSLKQAADKYWGTLDAG